jgi:hypothetical protein
LARTALLPRAFIDGVKRSLSICQTTDRISAPLVMALPESLSLNLAIHHHSAGHGPPSVLL